MSSAQKIIKYCAIAFAVFLIVSIFSGITYGVLGIVTAGNLISDNSTVESKCENTNEQCLQVNLAMSALYIKKGDSFKVETKNDKVNVKEDGNALVITENGRHVFESYQDREVTIYIPDELEFVKVAISGGAGSIYVEKLKVKELEMSLGIGATTVNSLDAESAKISAGIGEVSINLAKNAENYEIKADKGIGDIMLNGQSVPGDSVIGSGSHKITISGGIGSINITTAE